MAVQQESQEGKREGLGGQALSNSGSPINEVTRIERDDFIHSKSATCRQNFCHHRRPNVFLEWVHQVKVASGDQSTECWRRQTSRFSVHVSPKAVELPVDSSAEHFPSEAATLSGHNKPDYNYTRFQHFPTSGRFHVPFHLPRMSVPSACLEDS